ncbi:class I SAM-dependent methyltransferase [Streptomyces sp. NPDC048248]|uniref:class I SAM-dependent methyltransferase n=1 Tax=Streptomyces sp. NPDC048248 TaxID=3365523 RepID=UPI00371A58F8
MANSYAGLAPYYDLIMTSGYYDYDAFTRALLARIGSRKALLELGVGTGLVCEKLLELGPPDLRITGLDHTESMLAVARERLGDRVRLLAQDILEMSLPPTFDAAFSVGGIWYGVQDREHSWLGSHLPGEAEDLKGLSNLACALPPGGTLLLTLQEQHRSYRRTLPGGLVYAQEIHDQGDGRYVKDYTVLREGQVVAHQRSPFRLRSQQEADRLLEEAGFRFAARSPDRLLLEYTRL